MHVVFTISSLDRTAGGTSAAVAALVQHLAAWDCEVSVVSFASKDPLLEESTHGDEKLSVRLVERRSSPWSLWKNLSRFEQALREVVTARDNVVIHDNGIWLPVNHRVASVARSLQIPRVVSPHGMLEPWSLSQGAWKKKAAWWLYQERDLQTADIVVATARQEARNIRGLDIDRPIVTIPNGVDPPDDLPSLPDPTLRNRRTVLFLSRIHRKKGLLNLVEAWARLRPDGWGVVIAGPDEDGHESEVRRSIAKHDLVDDFVFTGPVQGSEKWGLYRSADLFVLPTHSENFGIVVAEALACGTPVVTTRQAPWCDLIENDCGWWVEVGVDPLVDAVADAIRMPAAEREEMGDRGMELAFDKYAWPRVAEKAYDMYKKLL